MLTLEQIEQQYSENLRSFQSSLLREYLQYKMLDIIFASEYATKLVFIGGTALRLIYDNNRFSEDIDFDNFGLTEEEFKKVSDKVKAGLEAEGFQVEISFAGRGSYRCNVRFPGLLFASGLSPLPEEKILIQIDSLAQGFDYQPEQKILNKFDVFTQIFAPSPDILLSQKINAVFSRKRAKGRDFYDIVFLLGFATPNYAYLQHKLNIQDAEELRKQLLEHSAQLNFDELANDVSKFLFNQNDRKKVVLFPEFIKQAKLE